MRVLECPACHGNEIYFEPGVSGQYRCHRCGYRGAFVIEKDIPQGE